jgi:hypothetical protein
MNSKDPGKHKATTIKALKYNTNLSLILNYITGEKYLQRNHSPKFQRLLYFF